MLKEFTGADASLWAVIATVICFTIFVGAAFLVLTDRRRSLHKRMEHLPLDDGTPHG
jgi:hypothetical protein